MAFEDITATKINYIKYSESQPGPIAQGLYTKMQMDPLFDRPRYFIEADDGTTTVLNATGQLDKIMEKVPFNTYLRVIFNGLSTITKGKHAGKLAYGFTVQADRDRSKNEQEQLLASF